MSLHVLYILPPTGKFAGIERVVDEIADQIAASFMGQICVDVLLCSEFPGMPVAQRRYTPVPMRPRKDPLSRAAAVRRAVSQKKYDLVVVPQIEATTLFWFACLGLGRKFALHLHGNPKLENTHLKANALFFLFREIVLRQLSAVFCISPRQMDYFKQAYPSDRPHFWVPNPVRAFPSTAPTPKPSDGTVTFVNIGRFCRQKGQDILLRAFALVHARRPTARLKIVGYGKEEQEIAASIAALGLSDAVQIEYHPHDPSPALHASDIYVSSSRWEGWSLAICEALRFGLPVAATDCEFGPSDILSDARLGRLSPMGDETALADTMVYYFDNIAAEKAHADFRRNYIRQFDASRVVHAHADALRQAAGSGSIAAMGAAPAS